MLISCKRLTCPIRRSCFTVVVAVVFAWLCVFTVVFNYTLQAPHRPRLGYAMLLPWTATVSNITHTTFQPTLTGQNHSIRERASVRKPASVDGHRASVQKPASVDGRRASVQKPASVDVRRASVKKPASVDGRRASVQKPASVDGRRASVQKPASVDARRASVKKPASVDGRRASVKKPASVDGRRASVKMPASVDGRSPFVNSTSSSDCKLPMPDGLVLPRNTQYLEQCSSSYPMISLPAVGKKKVILVYNLPRWVMGTDPDYKKTFKGCGLEDACIMTNDRRVLHTADAVVVHARLLHFSYPFAAISNSTRRPPQQMWVAFSLEPPPLMPQSARGWENVFNWTMTYRRDSDIFVPYGKLSLRTEAAQSARNFTQLALNKTKPVAWFVSNCATESARETYVKELSKYIQVDVYGKCGTLSCVRGDRHCKEMLSSTYFFYLSFENSLCVDYVTEKLFNPYGSDDVIPVARGGIKYDEIFPANTLINTANFKSPRHLANHLHDLMGDLQTYTAMLRAKHRFMVRKYELREQLVHGFCQLCSKLHDGDRTTARRVYTDFMDWVHKDACWRPTDL